MPWIEKEGRSVEEAKAAALTTLGLPLEDVEIEVVREGARGLFGLGGEPALVRARPRAEARDVRDAFHDRPPASRDESAEADGSPDPAVPAAVTESAPEAEPEDQADHDDEAAEERQRIAAEVATEMVSGIIERMGLKGDVQTRTAGGTVYVEVSGDEMGLLIGRGGKTLEALQDLVRAGVQRRLKARAPVVVDVESYWERRRESGRGRRREGSSRS